MQKTFIKNLSVILGVFFCGYLGGATSGYAPPPTDYIFKKMKKYDKKIKKILSDLSEATPSMGSFRSRNGYFEVSAPSESWFEKLKNQNPIKPITIEQVFQENPKNTDLMKNPSTRSFYESLDDPEVSELKPINVVKLTPLYSPSFKVQVSEQPLRKISITEPGVILAQMESGDSFLLPKTRKIKKKDSVMPKKLERSVSFSLGRREFKELSVDDSVQRSRRYRSRSFFEGEPLRKK